MDKVIIELGRVNKNIKLKFNLVFSSDQNIQNNKYVNNKIISKFNIQGHKFIKFAPFPYISISIIDEYESGKINKITYDKDSSINLGKLNRFYFVKRLNLLINAFENREYQLFRIVDGKLIVDPVKARECAVALTFSSSSALFIPCVIRDPNSNDTEYEGVLFSLNNNKYSCSLTFEEFEYMVKYIEKIDMDLMAMQIITAITNLNKHPEVDVQKEEEILTETSNIKEQNLIPNI